MKFIADLKTDRAWFTALLNAAQASVKTAKTAELKTHYESEVVRLTKCLNEVNQYLNRLGGAK